MDKTATLNQISLTVGIPFAITLPKVPERFRIMDLEPLRSMGIRRMLVDNYPVFYVVRDDRVIVTNVLCSGSDIVERLKNRLV